MKFLSFKSKSSSNKIRVGVLSLDEAVVIDINSIGLSKVFWDMNHLIENIEPKQITRIKDILDKNVFDNYKIYNKEQVDICSPILRPKHDIICVGVNYEDHKKETKHDPENIVFFSKRALEIKGHEDHIQSHIDIDRRLDYEVELGVIIGKQGVDIKKEDAYEYIFGYTIFNDITARTLQKEHLQWYKGKSLDDFSIMGPVIVHRDDIQTPINLAITSKVNEEIRQNSNTQNLIYDVASIIELASKGMTLEPGDIIATGTPSGVGLGFKPGKYMKSGDVVECEIEKIGILRNYIK